MEVNENKFCMHVDYDSYVDFDKYYLDSEKSSLYEETVMYKKKMR